MKLEDFQKQWAVEVEPPNELTDEQKAHQQRHVLLHNALDEVFADYIKHHPKEREFLKVTIRQLLEWSYKQTLFPEE